MIATATFQKAGWLARQHELIVVQACVAGVPAGVPLKDHWGAYVTATTGYIGTREQAKTKTMPKFLAYGRVVHSIHQHGVSADEILIDIAEQLDFVRSFPTRKDAENYAIGHVGHGRCPADLIDQAASDWHNAQAVSVRARACLPGALIEALEALLD